METKCYFLFKTAKKTRKENGFYESRYDAKVLYDFKLLLQVPELTEDDIQAITAEMANGCSWEHDDICFPRLSDFTHYTVKARYVFYNIYSSAGKRLYRIKQLTKVSVIKYDRISLLNDFDQKSYEGDICGYHVDQDWVFEERMNAK